MASARASRREWRDDLAIHEFMDLAKHACPDLRHRLILHNADLGPELVARAFPDREDAREIALMHVRQDLGWTPDLTAWLDLGDSNNAVRIRPVASIKDYVISEAASYLKLADDSPIRLVWDLLNLPLRFAPNHSALAASLLLNGLGPILARAVLGPPAQYIGANGQEAIVDYGWVCEGLIVALAGRIPTLTETLQNFDGREPKNPSSKKPLVYPQHC